MSKIDRCIIAVKECTKALMKLSFKNYTNRENYINLKISNKNKSNNNY